MIDAEHYEQAGIWGDDNVFVPEHQALRLAAIDALVLPGTASVLDVGAGDGRVLHHLAATLDGDPLLVAAERSRAALEHVRTSRIQASGDALPLSDRSVDTVLCCEVLEHLPPPVYDATRAELARVADRSIVITVPNRENRARADVRCAACGCRYNPDRHLRSFRAEHLEGLFDGFALDRCTEAGPRQPFYPRWARLGLERLGVLHRPGSPSCPQCGTLYAGGTHDDPAEATATAADGAADGTAAGRASGEVATGHRSRRYELLRAASPKVRHRYWLAARYRRR